MRLRDFLYLDTARLSDYMSALDPGHLIQMREKTKSENSGQPDSDAYLDDPPTSVQESKEERTLEKILSYSEKHSFNRLYESLESNIKKYDEYTDVEVQEIDKHALVEVSRNFEVSQLTQLIDSLLEFTQMVKGMGVTDTDPEAEVAIQGITMLFRGRDEQQKEIPIVSTAGDLETKVFFVARSDHILRGIDELEGESTLVGKIDKIIPNERELDLFDVLKLLPRKMRRSGVATDLKARLMEAFRSWPHELGGPIAEDAFILKGPLIAVSPLAVYR
ncbi:hypothetical protein [Streptomyces sp. B6B3]|uniref:DUF6414 family protein n=1 Tax=Streptomyces sp. B6B3 TaxID=3153570 RepID=UPI00325CFA9C